MLENLALREQLLSFNAKRPRPRLGSLDKVFWVALRKLWSGWKKPLLLVTPETVVRWHRTGFRLYWSWLSRKRHAAGRKPLSREVRELIFRIVAEKPTCGAPRIHGDELDKRVQGTKLADVHLSGRRPPARRSAGRTALRENLFKCWLRR